MQTDLLGGEDVADLGRAEHVELDESLAAVGGLEVHVLGGMAPELARSRGERPQYGGESFDRESGSERLAPRGLSVEVAPILHVRREVSKRNAELVRQRYEARVRRLLAVDVLVRIEMCGLTIEQISEQRKLPPALRRDPARVVLPRLRRPVPRSPSRYVHSPRSTCRPTLSRGSSRASAAAPSAAGQRTMRLALVTIP